MSNKYPGFLLDARMFLAQTSGCSLATTGIYMRCLMHQWDNGSIPSDPQAIRRICGATKAEVDESWWFLTQHFKPHGEGRLICGWFTETKGCHKMRKEGERRRTPRVLDVTASIWQRLRRIVIARDGNVCRYCGMPTENIHVDHVLPFSRGGKSVEENLVVACGDCNVRKQDRTPGEWEASRGR